MTGAALARLANTTRQAVHKANLPRTESGKYDLDNPEVYDWVKGRSRASRKQRAQTEETSDRGEDLEQEELEWKIRYLQARTDERELKNAQARSELIPQQGVTEFAGAFATGIRTYMLPMANRLAPRIVAAVKSGDDEAAVQNLIESEVSDAIERALGMGEAAIEELKAQVDEEGDDEADDPIED
jgi:hypothetical protein